MKPDAVAECFDVIEHGGPSLGDVVEALMVNQFVFEGAEEEDLMKALSKQLSFRLIEAVRPC